MTCKKMRQTMAVLFILFGLSGCGILDRETAAHQAVLDEAMQLIEEKQYPKAIAVLSEIEGNARAADLLAQLRYLISGDYIENLLVGVAAIDKDGKVIVCADEEAYAANNYEETREWTNIRRLSFAFCGIDAINNEGTFFSTLEGEAVKARNEQLQNLPEIAFFSTDSSNYAVVDNTGKLYVYNTYNDYLENESVLEEIQSWDDIVDVVGGNQRTAVLHGDGTVSFVYANKLPGQVVGTNKYADIYDDMKEWTDIVDISGGAECIAGLKSDGTVVVSHHMIGLGRNEKYFDVKEWKDIIAISMSYRNIIGLKRDGTVVTAGDINEKQKEVSGWRDIVAVSAGQNFHLGLKADGTLVVAGEGEGNMPLPDVTGVKNLLVPTIDVQKHN